MSNKLCHCGKPLHYENADVERMVNNIISTSGEFIEIRSLETGKKYKVQRHYILLHGIKSVDLDTYGFEEIL